MNALFADSNPWVKDKPLVALDLDGPDGNAFAILGAVKTALVKAGRPQDAKQFGLDATMGDYADLLATAKRYVDLVDLSATEDDGITDDDLEDLLAQYVAFTR